MGTIQINLVFKRNNGETPPPPPPPEWLIATLDLIREVAIPNEGNYVNGEGIYDVGTSSVGNGERPYLFANQKSGEKRDVSIAGWGIRENGDIDTFAPITGSQNNGVSKNGTWIISGQTFEWMLFVYTIFNYTSGYDKRFAILAKFTGSGWNTEIENANVEQFLEKYNVTL